MIFTNPPTEIFDYNWIRNLILDNPRSLYKEETSPGVWETRLKISNSVQSNMSHTHWENIFLWVDGGMKVDGAKVTSNETAWATIRDTDVPNTWPDWSITEGEPGSEVTRAKKFYEYFYTVRSELDASRCVFRWQKFLGEGIPIVENEYIPHNYSSLTNDLLDKIRALFGDNFFSISEAKAWRDINIPPQPII